MKTNFPYRLYWVITILVIAWIFFDSVFGKSLITVLLLIVVLLFSLFAFMDRTPKLIAAVEAGNVAKVRKLIAKGEDVNAKNKGGNTALMLASFYGHLDCIKLLLEAGADVNVKTRSGTTALRIATSVGHQECAKLLREAGAKEQDEDKPTTQP